MIATGCVTDIKIQDSVWLVCLSMLRFLGRRRTRTVFCRPCHLQLPNNANSNSEAGGGESGDSWEGKPLVRMVGDSDEDVYHILMAVYNARCVLIHI